MIGPSQELVRAAAIYGQVSGRLRSRPLREPGSADRGACPGSPPADGAQQYGADTVQYTYERNRYYPC